MIIRQLPNLLTSLNLSAGMFGIINIFIGDYTNTVFFVLLAGFFDLLDGFVARLVNASGDFGKELDSLADMVSFGVLPSLYLYTWMNTFTENSWLPYLAILIAVFSAIRLAGFNLLKSTQDFKGLPTPANAILITTFPKIPFSFLPIPYLFIGIVVVSCFLLVSNINMIGMKFKSWDLKQNIARYILLVSVLILTILMGLKALPYLIPLYILVSVVVGITSQN